MNDPILQSHSNEVRRGSVVIAILQFSDTPIYGYALIDLLKQAGIETDANTLYPLLRRLETQGMLQSVWSTDSSRPRKYYQVTSEGKALGSALLADWNRITTALNSLEGGRE